MGSTEVVNVDCACGSYGHQIRLSLDLGYGCPLLSMQMILNPQMNFLKRVGAAFMYVFAPYKTTHNWTYEDVVVSHEAVQAIAEQCQQYQTAYELETKKHNDEQYPPPPTE